MARHFPLYFNALWPGDTRGSYTLADWLRRFPHVQITGHGIFRYRRRVPSNLIAAAAKREILVSLKTKDRSVAELRFLEVHLQVERWMRSLDPGSPAADFQFSLSAQPANSKTALLAGKLTGYASSGVHSLKITDALVLYLKDKETEFNQYVGRTRAVRLNEKDRAIRYLIAALGQDREPASLTKNDARIFRDYLTSKGLKAGSVQKNLKVCAAIIQVGLDEAGLNVPNPFHRLRVVADVSPRDSRLSLSKEEVRIVLRGKRSCRPSELLPKAVTAVEDAPDLPTSFVWVSSVGGFPFEGHLRLGPVIAGTIKLLTEQKKIVISTPDVLADGMPVFDCRMRTCVVPKV